MNEHERKMLDSIAEAGATSLRLTGLLEDTRLELDAAKRKIESLKQQITFYKSRTDDLTNKNQILTEKNKVLRDTIKSYSGKIVVPDCEEDVLPWYKRMFRRCC